MTAESPSPSLAEPFGDYVLERLLGEGGMAVTYLAREKVSDFAERLVAVKQILPQFAADPKFREMFHDEVRVSSVLSHRNICRIYRAGQVEDTLYMAMEFVDGLSVADLRAIVAARGGEFPIEHALYLCAETLEGLHAAHTQKDADGTPLSLVHRDVSPQNVLVSKEGSVKVIDFGVAKAASNMSVTRTGAVKGKILYLSPEQLESKTLDGRSDVFSAGLMLYELLTNTHPFAGSDEHATIFNYISREVQPPSLLAARVPAVMDGVILKALSKDRDLRFSSAAEAARALTDVLYGLAPSYRPYQFADFVEWALDGDAGPMPAPGELSSMDITAAGVNTASTGPGLNTAPWSESSAEATPVAELPIPTTGQVVAAPPKPEPSGNKLLLGVIGLLILLIVGVIGAAVFLFVLNPEPSAKEGESIAAAEENRANERSPEIAESASSAPDIGEKPAAPDENTAPTPGESSGAPPAETEPEPEPGDAAPADDVDGSEVPPPEKDVEEDIDEDAGEPDEADGGSAWGTPSEPEDPPSAWGTTAPDDDGLDDDDGEPKSAWGAKPSDDDTNDAGAWGAKPPSNRGAHNAWGLGGGAGDDSTGGAGDGRPAKATNVHELNQLMLTKELEDALAVGAASMGANGTRVETYLRVLYHATVDNTAYMGHMVTLCTDVKANPWTPHEQQIIERWFNDIDPCM